jgi:hypothetical protein
MDTCIPVIGDFNTVDLRQADSLGLMQRYDTKFAFHRSKLTEILEYLKNGYSVVEIGGKRIFSYKTLYYDTEDLYFYRQHHDKKLSRYKLRCRTYEDTEESFFEVKCKTNKRKTIKDRCHFEKWRVETKLPDKAVSFARGRILEKDAVAMAQGVLPTLWVNYRRISLVNPSSRERVTVDVDLAYSDDRRSLAMNDLVIAEIKKSSQASTSFFSSYLKKMNVLPLQFSKYCMGIILMEKSKRYNRFKENVLVLAKNGLINGSGDGSFIGFIS